MQKRSKGKIVRRMGYTLYFSYLHALSKPFLCNIAQLLLSSESILVDHRGAIAPALFYDLGNGFSASSPNSCIVRTARSTFSRKALAVSRARRTVSVLKVLCPRVRK